VTKLEEKCVVCGKSPDELGEYASLAEDEGYDSPLEAMRGEEGTYNPNNGHFFCTMDYIKVGMPLGVAP
jgi:hypothetical protein